MLGESLNEQSAIEPLVDNRVEQYHDVAHIINNREVDDLEVVLGIEHVEVLNHFVVGDIALTERSGLVEDGERIAHTAVGLLCDNSQSLFFILDAFLLSDGLQMVDRVADGHPFEIVDLTAAEDGRQDLMLLGRSEDEDDVCGWLLQRFQKGVESGCGKHVHLVDDEDLVSADLRRDTCLFHQRLDVFHTVVGGRIEFEDVQRTLLVKRLTALALIAGLTLGRGVLTVDGLGEDTGTSGLSHTARTAEEVGMGQFSALHGVLQGGS